MSHNQQAILFLASWYPTPQNNHHGIFIKNHALALSKCIPVIVVYAYSSVNTNNSGVIKSKSGHLEEWLLEYKKVNFSFPIISSIIKYFRFKKAYKLLLEELIKSNISIKAIQLNTIFPAAIILSSFKNYYKVPHCIVEHWSGYLPEDGNYKGFLQTYFTEKAVASAAKLFYVSEKQKDAMLNHGLNGNYELLYNVVNTTVFCENKNKKNIRPLLLHVSSLVEKEKNITGTLNVIQKLQKSNYQFDVVIVGGDEQSISYYIEQAKNLELTTTTFVGEKTQAEVAEYMQQAHVLLLFSNYEGMPVVVLEAMATGLPVFASKVGQLPLLITGDFGKLVSIGNEDEMQNYLMEFLDGKLTFDSQKMIDFISKNASQDVVGKKLADFYNNDCSSTNLVNSTN